MTHREKSNEKLFAFLDRLRSIDWDEVKSPSFKDQSNSNSFRAIALEWIDAQSSTAIKALRSLKEQDFPMLVKVAASNGGFSYLHDR